jgi:hypothetical protein
MVITFRGCESIPRAGERETVWRNDYVIGFHVDETLSIKLLRIDDRAVNVRKKFELVSAPHVIAIAGSAIRNNLATIDLFDLTGLERLNHFVLCGHAANPAI